MFRPSAVLQFAKIAVKEVKTAVKRVDDKRRLTSRRSPDKPLRAHRFSLFDLINCVPKPLPGTPQSEWKHKNGWGLKFYRKQWALYSEPCYWTITRFKARRGAIKPKVWGVLTWRGQTESRVRKVRGSHKQQWRYLPDGPDPIRLNLPSIKQKMEHRKALLEFLDANKKA